MTPNVGDQVLSPGETVQVDFVIGLQAPTPFTFFVDLFGEPMVSGSFDIPTTSKRDDEGRSALGSNTSTRAGMSARNCAS